MAQPQITQAEAARLLADYDARQAAKRPRSPSARTPTRPWYLNTADRIERELLEDGHQVWGYVIYRSTYESDSDWNEFLRRLRTVREKTFASCNGNDILQKFQLTVLEDPAFDGASAQVIRQHFQQWTRANYHGEQSAERGSSEESGVSMGKSQRYRFAIQVDAAALDSVVREATVPLDPHVRHVGWVRLVDKTWSLGTDERRNPMLNSYEPIEGIPQNDVGWVKVPYNEVQGHWYTYMRGLRDWIVAYRRPPAIIGSQGIS